MSWDHVALSGRGGVEEWLNADMSLNKFPVPEGHYRTVCIVTKCLWPLSSRNLLKYK